MVKEANSKLSALQQELQELDSQILLTQGQGGASLDSSFTNNLGALQETVTEGGEVAFITQMINESILLKETVR